MGAAADVVDLPALDVHAADEHRLGPGEIGRRPPRHVFVDEAHLQRRGSAAATTSRPCGGMKALTRGVSG